MRPRCELCYLQPDGAAERVHGIWHMQMQAEVSARYYLVGAVGVQVGRRLAEETSETKKDF